MFKLIVAGGRDFQDYAQMCDELGDVLQRIGEPVQIVCGMARGADLLGLEYARRHDLPVLRMPADWNTHGRSAGFVRNAQMVDVADGLVAFWDGRSRGTKHTIDLARAKRIKTRISYYQGV